MRTETLVLLSFIMGTISKDQQVDYQLPSGLLQSVLQTVVQCMFQTEITPEIWDTIKNNTNNHDDNFKEFIYCLALRVGFVDEQGHPVKSRLYEVFNDDKLRMTIDNCEQEATGDPVEASYGFYMCSRQNKDMHMLI